MFWVRPGAERGAGEERPAEPGRGESLQREEAESAADTGGLLTMFSLTAFVSSLSSSVVLCCRLWGLSPVSSSQTNPKPPQH